MKGVVILFASCVSATSAFSTPSMSLGALSRRSVGNAAASSVGWLLHSSNAKAASPLVKGSEEIMAPKAHGTTASPVQEGLLYGVNRKLADNICSYNRRFAENAWYYTTTSFEADMKAADGPVTFYDSVTGKPLFRAPVGRSVDAFLSESSTHGWPSFRDEEVVWDNVRVLRDGESVSVDGTHLGHNLPDKSGNRYCINLVSIAGKNI